MNGTVFLGQRAVECHDISIHVNDNGTISIYLCLKAKLDEGTIKNLEK